MGYTLEGKKIVIWTVKRFISEPWPWQDEGENHTYFYSNLKSKDYFATCLSVLSDFEKIKIVSDRLGLDADKIALRSKKSHHKAHPRKKNV